MTDVYAAIEAGGTKFNCAVFDSEHTMLDECRIPTTTPSDTLSQVEAFFSQYQSGAHQIKALGVASFGPLDLNPQSPSFGAITKTPKPHWSNTPLLSKLVDTVNCPAAIDTDVNGAALAESLWGAGQGKDVVVYVTVGTGIGGGVVINGKPLHGLVHPEIGHMLLPGHPDIKGVCPFHKNCAEGLASGKAMGEIWQQPAETLPDSHPAWDIEAQVLAQLCHGILMSFSPQCLILGGGVMAKPGLLTTVIDYTESSLNGYLSFPGKLGLSNIITSPGLGEKSGLMGALALAQRQAKPVSTSSIK